MKNSILVKIIAIIIIAIAVIKVFFYSVVGVNYFIPFIQLNNMPDSLPGLFYLKWVYFILLLVSGLGILKAKRWAVNGLFILLLSKIIYEISVGVYNDVFALLGQNQYTILQKTLMGSYFFGISVLLPVLICIFFSLPSIKGLFSEKT